MKKLIFISLIVYCFSCSGGDEEAIDTTVSIYPSIISLDSYLPVDTFITISCKTDWKIENAPEWCFFKETKGEGNNKIALHIPKNESPDRRYVNIKINNAELTVDQQGDIIKNGDKVGFFQFDNSGLTVVEYRIKGNVESPDDKYTLIGGGTMDNDLKFYFQDGQYRNYYLGTSLKFQHKISNTYYSENFGLRLMYEGKQSRYGYNFIQKNILDLKNVSLNEFMTESTNDYSITLSGNKYVTVFNNCKFTHPTNKSTYYIVNGTLNFEMN